VNCHARALVLLAREVARRGVRSTTENLHTLMARLHEKHPDDREQSLFASLELSLLRLPEEMRRAVQVLAPFQGGAHQEVVRIMFEVIRDALTARSDEEVETETAQKEAPPSSPLPPLPSAQDLLSALQEVGLASHIRDGHFRLDPALPAYLRSRDEIDPMPSASALEEAWSSGMGALCRFLYEQQSKNAELAAQLTLLELPNLLAWLEWLAGHASPEDVVGEASKVEDLIRFLGRPRAMEAVVAIRKEAAGELGDWSKARYLDAGKSVDRLLERGDLPGAFQAAQDLLQQCQAAGEDAYPGADYDLAVAHFRMGRVLSMAGQSDDALPFLEEARTRFQAQSDAGREAAAQMASVCLTEIGDCLAGIGRLDAAADAYEEGIRLTEQAGRQREFAVLKEHLATARMDQKRYEEALAGFHEALTIYQELDEPGSVATAWHQIGMVYRMAGQFDEADAAYRKSLAIKVRQDDRSAQASSLGELGNLYDNAGRLEEAVTFYRQAADIHVELQDFRYEGADRNNIANSLIKLGRYDEARPEIHRAIECKERFGHAAEPWMSWEILNRLETATGNPEAAAEARGKAIETYRAYRLQGGYSRSNVFELIQAVGQAIQQGKPALGEQVVAAWEEPNDPAWAKALARKLRDILGGGRRPDLVEDPEFNYAIVVELELLLEELGS